MGVREKLCLMVMADLHRMRTATEPVMGWTSEEIREAIHITKELIADKSEQSAKNDGK